MKSTSYQGRARFPPSSKLESLRQNIRYKTLNKASSTLYKKFNVTNLQRLPNINYFDNMICVPRNSDKILLQFSFSRQFRTRIIVLSRGNCDIFNFKKPAGTELYIKLESKLWRYVFSKSNSLFLLKFYIFNLILLTLLTQIEI